MPTRLTKAPRIDLELVRAFVAVHDAGSFSAAALRLGVPRSTVSRAVAALEESLALLLFHRTTRRVATTAAGVALYDRVAPALGTIDAALSDLPDTEEEPSGTLRLTTTPDLGTIVVAEAVTRYTARYPRTQVELQLSSSLVDLVRDGFDLALRVSPGPRRDSALIARKVGDIMIQLYAAPAYLARRGTPRSPAELRDHDWIGFRGAAPLQLSAVSQMPAEPRHGVELDWKPLAGHALAVPSQVSTVSQTPAEPGSAAEQRVRRPRTRSAYPWRSAVGVEASA